MARRRTKREDMITPIPTPDRQLEHPSGWCMTNDHVDCKYQFNHGKCGCGCHTAPPAPAKKRGRPKGSKNKPKEA